MNKAKVIKEMMLDVPQKIVAYDGNPAGQHLYGEQRQQIAEVLYEAGYRKIDEFAECRNCPAWAGTDCTRHPYTQGCLKDENNIKRLAAKDFAEKLKARLAKFIWKHNIPECMFNDVIAGLLKKVENGEN